MIYTQAEKEKIYDNLDKIKEYLESLQPQIRSSITIDFGEMKTYASWDREREFHLTVEKDRISGRSGGLGLDYSRESISSSTRSTVYSHFDYAVALMQNWRDIKHQILVAIEDQNRTIKVINNFEL